MLVFSQLSDRSHRFRAQVDQHAAPLRHTCASRLLSKGIDAKVTQERLGHADIAMTVNTYSHVLPNMQKEAAEAIENLLF